LILLLLVYSTVPKGAMSAYISSASVQNSKSLENHFMAAPVSLAANDFVMDYVSSLIFVPAHAIPEHVPLLTRLKTMTSSNLNLTAGTGYGGKHGELSYDAEQCWGNLIPLPAFPQIPAEDAKATWEWRPQYVFPRCVRAPQPVGVAASLDAAKANSSGNQRLPVSPSPLNSTIPERKSSLQSSSVKRATPVPSASPKSVSESISSANDQQRSSKSGAPSVDFAFTVRFSDRDRWGPMPLVMIDLINDTKQPSSKRFQLASYSIDATWIWPADVPFIQLGIALNRANVAAWAFFRTVEGKMCSATILEHENIDSPYARAFFDSIPNWCQRVVELLRTNDAVQWSLSPFRYVRIKDDFVYKVYDYRCRPALPKHERRSPGGMKAHIPGAEVREWNGMSMVRYPRFQGECCRPTRLADVVAAIAAVQVFLDRNVGQVPARTRSESDVHVHGDIRWANLVVDADTIDSSKSVAHLIDFDYSSYAGQPRVYPSGLVLQLPDGERHPEVSPGVPLRARHDVYACGGLLAKVMSPVEALDRILQNAAGQLKQAAETEIGQGLTDSLRSVLALLRAEQPSLPISMRDNQPVERTFDAEMGTGSPE